MNKMCIFAFLLLAFSTTTYLNTRHDIANKSVIVNPTTTVVAETDKGEYIPPQPVYENNTDTNLQPKYQKPAARAYIHIKMEFPDNNPPVSIISTDPGPDENFSNPSPY